MIAIKEAGNDKKAKGYALYQLMFAGEGFIILQSNAILKEAL